MANFFAKCPVKTTPTHKFTREGANVRSRCGPYHRDSHPGPLALAVTRHRRERSALRRSPNFRKFVVAELTVLAQTAETSRRRTHRHRRQRPTARRTTSRASSPGERAIPTAQACAGGSQRALSEDGAAF